MIEPGKRDGQKKTPPAKTGQVFNDVTSKGHQSQTQDKQVLSVRQTMLDSYADTGVNSFPLDEFPKPIQDLILARDIGKGVDRNLQAGANLAVLSAAVGKKFKYRLDADQQDFCSVWTAIVGSKAMKKSVAIGKAKTPFTRKIDPRLEEEFQQQHKEWKKNKEQGPEPDQKSVCVVTGTLEKVMQMLSKSNHALLMAPDELKGWFVSHTKYNTDNVSEWLSIFSHHGGSRATLKRGIETVTKPFVAVTGSIQPSVLYPIFSTSMDNGLMDRILYALPWSNEVRTGNHTAPTPEQIAAWDNLVLIIYDLQTGEDGPRIIDLTPDALKLFLDYKEETTAFVNKQPRFERWKEEHLVKKQDYVLRLALILEVMRLVTDDLSNLSDPNTVLTAPPDMKITARSVHGAIKIVTHYEISYRDILQKRVAHNYFNGIKKDVEKQAIASMSKVFRTAEWEAVCSKLGIPRSSSFYILEKHRTIIKPIRHGVYELQL